MQSELGGWCHTWECSLGQFEFNQSSKPMSKCGDIEVFKKSELLCYDESVPDNQPCGWSKEHLHIALRQT